MIAMLKKKLCSVEPIYSSFLLILHPGSHYRGFPFLLCSNLHPLLDAVPPLHLPPPHLPFGPLTSIDINAKSTLGGNTALHRAAETGNPGAIRTLLRRGIDYNAKNFFGNTALHIAAKKVAEDSKT